MEITTFEDLIDWTRQLHAHLSRSLHESAKLNNDERASALLDYLSRHESLLEKAVREFENQAEPKAMSTRLYDYLNNQHKPIGPSADSYTHYASMSFEDIAREVFQFHDQFCDFGCLILRKNRHVPHDSRHRFFAGAVFQSLRS